MKFSWLLPREQNYESGGRFDSKIFPGVRYTIRRISLGRRIELTRQARELALKNEFLRAGDATDQLEAAFSELLVRRMYLEWGLVSVEGLRIDGRPATPESMAAHGPELLADEIIESLRSELGLTEEERKNF
jgi:hypothetical protein